MTYQQLNVNKPDNPNKPAGDSVINLRLVALPWLVLTIPWMVSTIRETHKWP